MLNNDWEMILTVEMKKGYFQRLWAFIEKEYQNKMITPAKERIFYAFAKTPFQDVKVVILGQDPYPEKGVATGLAFATFAYNKAPRSLENIKKLLYKDQGVVLENPELEHWAAQGVFLLNTTLTNEVNKINAHVNLGWEIFTDEVIKKISEKKEGVVFVLLGGQAQSKEKIIDKTKHYIIKTSHPSPLSAHQGFMESCLFSQINEKLKEKIKW